MKLNLLLFIFITSLNSNAQNAKDSFSVVVEGTRSHLNYIKARSELTMSRSTKFCRGSKMPKAVGEWTCKNTAPRLSSCVLEYKCHFVNKRFNRLSESRRLRSNLKDIPHLKSKYTISLLYKDKKQNLKEVDEGSYKNNRSQKVVTSKIPSQKFKSSKTTKKRIVRKKKVPIKKKLIARKKAPIKRKMVARKKAKSKASSEQELEEIAFLKDDGLDLLVESEQSVPKEIITNDDSEEEVASLSFLKDENDESNNGKIEGNKKFYTKFDLVNFAVSYISISDSDETSLATLGFSWTPHLWFSKHLGVRGNLGFHSYQTPETDLLESETFLIYDIGIYGQYLFTNLFFEIGFGTQKWNSEELEGASTLAVGVGYLFDEKKLYVFDRVSLEMSSILNEVSTKELKLNIGVSF